MAHRTPHRRAFRQRRGPRGPPRTGSGVLTAHFRRNQPAVPSPNYYLCIAKSLPRVAGNQRRPRAIYPVQPLSSRRFQMKRTLTAGIAATALIAATTFSAPSAQAYPVWVIPAIIAAGVGGVAIGGAAAAANRPYAYE